jgi:hypothetical protein
MYVYAINCAKTGSLQCIETVVCTSLREFKTRFIREIYYKTKGEKKTI